MNPAWRDRLRLAVERTGKKHSAVAWDAGVNPATLSRILNGHLSPKFETVVRIAHAADASVGWVAGEPPRGIELTERERTTIRAAGVILLDAFKGQKR